MSKADVLACIRRSRIVPVIRTKSPESAFAAIDALLKGGIDVLEVTMTVPGAIDVIREAARLFGHKALVGAGTVLNPATAKLCIEAGAQFVISPAVDVPTIELCRSLDTAVMPGALTPTEVLGAWRAGADMVKLFPCDALGGAAYVRALRAPMPEIPLLPTGGVNLENVAEFFAAGADAVGVGSALIDPSLEPADLTARARSFVAAAAAKACSGK